MEPPAQRALAAMTDAALHAAFARLAASTWHGVPGVAALAGHDPGPVVAITAMTHGNEPSGLAAIAHVLARADGGWRPVRGTLVLCVNNLAAARRWFAATTPQARAAARFVDCDMNRLPEDVLTGGDAREECRRARELAPAWRRFDVAMDIHSTGLPAPPMVVEGRGDWRPWLGGVGIGIAIRGIADVQIGIPAFALYGGTTFEIETGAHDDPAGMAIARTAADALLHRLDAPDTPAPPCAVDVYEVEGSVRLPHPGYALARRFPNFTPIAAGEVLARGPAASGRGIGPDLVAPRDGHAIFAPPDGAAVNVTTESLFLTKPVRRETGGDAATTEEQ
jgi:hypothetical protein